MLLLEGERGLQHLRHQGQSEGCKVVKSTCPAINICWQKKISSRLKSIGGFTLPTLHPNKGNPSSFDA